METAWSSSKKRVEWFGGGRTKLPEQLKSDSWVKEQCGKKWQIYSLNYKLWIGSSFLESGRNGWTCMDMFASQSLSRQKGSRGCVCSFPSHTLDFEADLRVSEGSNSVMTRLRTPKWQFRFILLKHLHASCCSDEPSSVPAGNVSDPGKTEVLGEKGISLNRKKNVFQSFRTMSCHFGQGFMGSWAPEKILSKRQIVDIWYNEVERVIFLLNKNNFPS